MKREYYQEYYTLERRHWWFLVRAQILAEQVQTYKNRIPNAADRPLRILNVGVATGATSEMLARFGEVTSVEYDAECAEFTSQVLKKEVIQGSITELPFADGAFDLVCAFDVVEHVEDHVKAVAEMHRVCASGGLVAVTVPAFMSLWSQHDVINHHYRRYRMAELLELFKPLETKQLRKTYFNSLLFPPIWAVRRLLNLVRGSKPAPSSGESTGSDFEVMGGGLLSRMSNAVFYGIFTLERWLLRAVNFPFGVSAFALYQKSPAHF